MTNSFDINQFNTLIQQATDSIMCNSDCKNKREAEKLKQTYLDSQTNLAKAPNNLMVAQKITLNLQKVLLPITSYWRANYKKKLR